VLGAGLSTDLQERRLEQVGFARCGDTIEQQQDDLLCGGSGAPAGDELEFRRRWLWRRRDGERGAEWNCWLGDNIRSWQDGVRDWTTRRGWRRHVAGRADNQRRKLGRCRKTLRVDEQPTDGRGIKREQALDWSDCLDAGRR